MTHFLYLVAGFFALSWSLKYLLGPAISAVKCRRLRFFKRPLEVQEADHLPPLVRARLPSALAFLEQQGFDAPLSLQRRDLIAGLNIDLHYLLAQHPANHSWALILLHNASSADAWWDMDCFACLPDQVLYTCANETPAQSRLDPSLSLAASNSLLPEKTWALHLQRLADASAAALPQSAEAMIERLERLDLTLATPHLFTPNADGSFSPSLYFGWHQYLFEQRLKRQRQQLLLDQPKLRQTRQAALAHCGVAEQQLAGFNNYLALKQQTRGSASGKSLLLIGSLALFALAFGVGLDFSWLSVLLLIGVLLVHEGGHLFGMWLFGYRDLGMLFIPFLGALASGRKEQISPWQEAAILLLGPVPGYLLGIYLLTHATAATPDWVHQLALMAVFVNVFNLLPFPPLDGGQLMNLAIFNRFPRLQPFLLLLFIGLLAWLGISSNSTLVWLLAFVLLLALPASFRESLFTRRLLAGGHFRTGNIEAGALLDKLKDMTPWQQLPQSERWPLLDALLLRLKRSQTSRAAGLGIFLLWAGCLLAAPLLVLPPASLERLQQLALNYHATPAEKLDRTKRLYANAGTDADRADYALRIMYLQDSVNRHTGKADDASVQYWWRQAKQLSANGQMTSAQRGDLLLRLANSCQRVENNCEAAYLRQALIQFDATQAVTPRVQTLYRLARLDYLPVAERLAATRSGIQLVHEQNDADLATLNSSLLWIEGSLLVQQGQTDQGEAALFASIQLPDQSDFDGYRQFQRTRLASYLVASDQAPRAIGLLAQWRQDNLHVGNTDDANEDAYFLLTLLFQDQPQVAAGYVKAASHFNGFGPIEQALGQVLLGIAQGKPDYHSVSWWAALLEKDDRDERYDLWQSMQASQAPPEPLADVSTLAITRHWYQQMHRLLDQPELLPLKIAFNRINQKRQSDD